MKIWKRAKASFAPKELLLPNPQAPLREQVREVLRFHHYSLRTEKAYWQWIRRYLAFHRRRDHSGPQKGWRHPCEMGAAEVTQFLTHLALAGNVAASTQNQALNALVFLYREVLQQTLGDLGMLERPSRPARLPVVSCRTIRLFGWCKVRPLLYRQAKPLRALKERAWFYDWFYSSDLFTGRNSQTP